MAFDFQDKIQSKSQNVDILLTSDGQLKIVPAESNGRREREPNDATLISRSGVPTLAGVSLLSLLLAACNGGGGSGSSGGGGGGVTTSGVVVDGYLKGIKVYHEGSPGTFVITDANGAFSGLAGTGALIAEPVAGSTVDTSTSLAFLASLMAPSGATVINPLTTILKQLGVGQEAALKAALGLNANINLLTYDPVHSGDVATQLVSAQIGNLLSAAVKNTEGSDTVSSKLAAKIAAHETVDLTSSSFLQSLGLSPNIADAVAKANSVSVTDLAGIASVQTLVQQLSLADSAGQSAALNKFLADFATVAIAADPTPPSAPTDIVFSTEGGTVVAGVVNATNTNFTAHATIVAGQATGGKAELLVNGVVVATDSAISATDTRVDFTLNSTTNAAVRTALGNGGAVAVKVYDVEGRSVSTTAASGLTTDYVAPTLSITSPSIAGLRVGETAIVTLTFSEAPVGFVLGDLTTSLGALTELTVSQNDPKVYTAKLTPTANTEGNSAITLTGAFTDAAGNAGTANNSLSFVVDTKPPVAASVSLTALSGGATASEATAANAIQVTGERGAALTVTITGQNNNVVTKHVTGTGSLQNVDALTADELTTLGQGAVTVSVTQSDALGNAQTAVAQTASFTLDTIAPVAASVALTGLTGGATAAEAKAADAIKVTGENGGTVHVTFTGRNGSFSTDVTGTGSAQSVTLSDDNLTTLGQGLVTVSVTQSDAAGNAQTADATTATFTLDTIAPTSLSARTPTLNPASDTGASHSDGVTNNDKPTIVIDLSGQGYVKDDIVILREGSTEIMRVTLTDDDISSGLTNFSLTVPQGKALPQGTHSLTIEVVDAAGNIGGASAAVAVVVDTTPPTLTMNQITGDIGDPNGFSITGTATGADGQIVSVTLNEKTYTGVVENGQWMLSISAADAGALGGDYSVTASVSDLAGNDAVSATRMLSASQSGIASDGYISGALYFIDTNNNDTLDAGEAFTIGDAVGNYRLPSGALVMKGGVDISTGLEFTSVYEAPTAYRTITPITTLVSEISKLQGSSVANAESLTKDLIGSNVDLKTFNPLIAAVNATTEANFEAALAYQKVAAQLSIYMDVGSSLLGHLNGANGADEVLAQTQDFSLKLVHSLAEAMNNTPDGLSGADSFADAAFIKAVLTQLASSSTLTEAQTTALIESAAELIALANTKIAAITATHATSADTIAALKSITQYQVVAKGDITTALLDYIEHPTTVALPTYTDSALSTAAGNASIGVVVPSLITATMTGDAVQAEGSADSGASWTFTFTRSGDTSSATELSYEALLGGNASAADFGGTIPSGKITFAAGETSKTFTFTTVGNDVAELQKSFSLKVYDAHGQTQFLDAAGKPTGGLNFALALTNDDAPGLNAPASLELQAGLTARVAGVSVDYPDADAVLTVTLSGGADSKISLLAAADIASGNSTNSVTLTGKAAAINAALATLSVNLPDASSLTMTVSAAGVDNVTSATIPVNLHSAPTAAAPEDHPTLVAGSASHVTGFTVADLDSDITVQISVGGGKASFSPVSGVTAGAGGDGSIYLTGAPSAVSEALASMSLTATAAGQVTVSLKVIDGDAVTVDPSLVWSTTALGAPTLLSAPGTLTISQSNPTLIPVSISDADSAVVSAAITPTGGSVAFATGTGATILTAASGVTTITGSVVSVNKALASMTFKAPNTGAASISITVDDFDATTASTTSVIDLTVGVNAPPEAGGDKQVAAVREDTPSVITLTGLNLVDSEGSAPTQIRILSVGGGTVTTANGDAITLGSDGTALSVSGKSLSLRFTPAANSTTEASIIYVVVDPAVSGLNSAPSVITVPITAVNDAPVLALNAAPRVFIENASPLVLAPGLALSDVDDSQIITSATVTLSTGASSDDVLAISSALPFAGAATFRNGVLTITGTGTVSEYQAILRSVTFSNSSDAPSTAARAVTFQVSDGQDLSVAQVVNLTVTAVNDAPVIVSPTTPLAAIEQVSLDLTGKGLSVSDVDAGSDAVTVTIKTVQGSLFASPDQGSGVTSVGSGDGKAVTLTGSIASINDFLAGGHGRLTYIQNSDTPPASDPLTITVRDGAGASALTTVKVIPLAITAVNDAPVLDLNGVLRGNDAVAIYATDGPAVTLAPSATLSDPDSSTFTKISASVSGADASDVLFLTLGAKAAATAAGATVNVIAYANGAVGLEITGAALSTAATQAILQGIAFSSTVAGESRDISISVTDATLVTSTQHVTLALSETPYAKVTDGVLVLTGDPGSDVVTVNLAVDRVTGEDGTRLTVAGNLTSATSVDASASDVRVQITGDDLSNILKGSSQADVLTGGAGADTLTGGGGDDRFVFGSEAGSSTSTADRITDLSIGDRINLPTGLTWQGVGSTRSLTDADAWVETIGGRKYVVFETVATGGDGNLRYIDIGVSMPSNVAQWTYDPTSGDLVIRPTMPGTPTVDSAIATGVSAAELLTPFDVSVALTAGAANVGDTVQIVLGAASVSGQSTVIGTKVLTADDLSGVTIALDPSTVSGFSTEGAKALSSRILHADGTTGVESGSLRLTVDTTAPTATISVPTSGGGSGVGGAGGGSGPQVTDGVTSATIVFSENVTGFDKTDLSITNGVINSVTKVDDHTYTIAYKPTSISGVITLTGDYADVAGNAGTKGASLSFTTAAPVLTGSALARTIDEDANNTGRVVDGSFTLTDADNHDFAGGSLRAHITNRVAFSGVAGEVLSIRGLSDGSVSFRVDGDNIYYRQSTLVDPTGTVIVSDSNPADDILIGSFATVSTVRQDGTKGADLLINLNENATPAITQTLASNIVFAIKLSGGGATEAWQDFVKPDTSVKFTLSDGQGNTSVFVKPITVVAHNDAPVATSDTATISQTATAPVEGNVLTNDTDADNVAGLTQQTLTVSFIASGEVDAEFDGHSATIVGRYGTLTISDTGAYSYELDSGNADVAALVTTESLVETFDYKVSDGVDETTSQLAITINGTVVNIDPVANADAAATVPASAKTGNVVTNDTDPNSGQTLTVTSAHAGSANDVTVGVDGVTIQGAYGTLKLAANGAYTYTPDANNAAVKALVIGDHVTDEFTYAISDGHGGTASSTLTLTVNGSTDNAAPVAVADTAATVPASAKTGNVVTNDTDANSGQTLIVTSAHAASADDVTVGVDGVTLQGAYGSLSLAANGAYTYTPDTDNAAVKALFTGEHVTDVFTYAISDGHGGTASSTLTLTVNGSTDNAIPVAVADTAATVPASAKTGNVVTNDTDANSGQTLTVTSAHAASANDMTVGVDGVTLQGAYGSLSLAANGAYTYTPDTDNAAVKALFTGDHVTDVFTYAISDGHGGTASSTLTLTVNGSTDNAIPVALADAASTVPASAKTGNVVTNDTDANSGQTLTVTSAHAASADDVTVGVDGVTLQGAYGSLSLAANGAYTYTPDANNAAVKALVTGDHVTDVFTYAISDGHGGTASSTLTLTVNGTADNADPVANADAASTVPASAKTGNVVTNDTDANSGQTLIVTSAQVGTAEAVTVESGSPTTLQGTYGSLSLAANGAYTYTPDANNAAVKALLTGDHVTDEFTYEISDGHGGTSSSTLTLTVNGSTDNTAPVAVADAAATVPASAKTGNVVTNDTDANSGQTLIVTSAHAGTADEVTVGVDGVTLQGAYGSLSLAANGAYTYTPDTDNADVKALFTGDHVTDVFTYAISDGHGGTASSTLTLTVNGDADPSVVAPFVVSASVAGMYNILSDGVIVGLVDIPDGSTSVAWTPPSDFAPSDGLHNYTLSGGAKMSLNGGEPSSTFSLNIVDIADLPETPADNTLYIIHDTKAHIEAADVSGSNFTGLLNNHAVLGVIVNGSAPTNGDVVTFTAANLPVFAYDTQISLPSTARSVNEDSNNTGRLIAFSGTGLAIANGTSDNTLVGPAITDSDGADAGGMTLRVHINNIVSNSVGGDVLFVQQGSELFRTDDLGHIFYRQDTTINGTSGDPVAIDADETDDFQLASYAMNDSGQFMNGKGGRDLILVFSPTATIDQVQLLAAHIGFGIRLSNIDGEPDYTQAWKPYLPASGVQQSVTFTITDAAGRSNSASRDINVTAANDAPVAHDDLSAIGNSQTSVSGWVLGNDDPDILPNVGSGSSNLPGGLAVTSVSHGSTNGTLGSSFTGDHGSLIINANGTYTYTLDTSDSTVQSLTDADAPITDVFHYTMTDGTASSSADLTILIDALGAHWGSESNTASSTSAVGEIIFKFAGDGEQQNIYAFGGADVLGAVGPGTVKIDGGDGDDIMFALANHTSLKGGAGADKFVIGSADIHVRIEDIDIVDSNFSNGTVLYDSSKDLLDFSQLFIDSGLNQEQRFAAITGEEVVDSVTGKVSTLLHLDAGGGHTGDVLLVGVTAEQAENHVQSRFFADTTNPSSPDYTLLDELKLISTNHDHA